METQHDLRLTEILARTYIDEHIVWILSNDQIPIEIRQSYHIWYERFSERNPQPEIDNYWIAHSRDYYTHHDKPYFKE